MATQCNAEVLIAGAGVIGLSLALELEFRGARVTVLDAGTALHGASNAAAGMLAANDPHNPPLLYPLSRFSLDLYPGFLDVLRARSGLEVLIQTERTLQYGPAGRSSLLAERSLDPRQLGDALLETVRKSSIVLQEHCRLERVEPLASGVRALLSNGESLLAAQFVSTAGAWSGARITAGLEGLPVRPKKGQMLRVRMPLEALREVHRSQQVYVVPRLYGPQAGSALIGATVEDIGFDLSLQPSQLEHLRQNAAALSPALDWVGEAPMLEAWAGLRPATPDDLPYLGRLDDQMFVAAGHYRNGILLAPGTARVMADLLQGSAVELDLEPFSPSRALVVAPPRVANAG